MPPTKNSTAAASKRRKHATFDEHYKSVYGSRWAKLRAAMSEPSVKVAMWNRLSKVPMEPVVEGLTVLESPTLRLFRASADEDQRFPLLDQPPRDEHGVPAYYLLDYASTMIVEQLQVDGFHHVLDLCAAPGGKSIAIAQSLSPQGEITSNEANRERAARLKRNLHEFIPPNSCIWQVTLRDATTWHSPEAYDRVLVDAPCSSERHLLQQPGGTSDWTPNITHDLAKVQGALLLRAFEAAKCGGRIVYSTCSISSAENDDVVAYALARTRCHIESVETKLVVGEPTKHGWIVLPDTAGGWGPMFCATFHKIGSNRPLTSSDDDDDDEDEDDATPSAS